MRPHHHETSFVCHVDLLSYRTVKKSRDEYIKRLNGIYRNNLAKDNVEYIVGHATFKGPNEVMVGDTSYTAKHILIATGTKPIFPAGTPGTGIIIEG